jgi:hypothetical protein
MLLLPALAALVLYAPVLKTGFVGDDFGLLHSFDGCDGLNGILECVGRTFVSGVGPPSNQYRPLAMASFALSARIGADPFEWHLVSLLLQMGNAALVALLAWQLQDEDTPRARAAALMAGWLFAWFAPAVEATAWIAARFDGLALFWLLVAACAFVASERWRDGFGLLSLVATVLSYMSKESAAIGAPLILALAWHRQGLARAVPRALPWLLVAAAYFGYRRHLFGNAFQFFPGSTPLEALLSGEWLAHVPGLLAWAEVALPEPGARTAMTVSGVALLMCAVAAGVAERAKGRVLVALALAFIAAFALLLPHWQWAATGEGGRVLLAIGAIAMTAAALPLAAAGRPRTLAWIAAIALLGSQYVLASAAVERWVRAGEDTRALARDLAALAQSAPANSYAFVVVPDHVGAIPFGRNAQGGLMLPPVQPEPLGAKLVVQTPVELARWPDLFERDIIGRLKREPATSVAANPLTPKVPPPHALPDRYYCWSPQARALQPVTLALAPDRSNWGAAWRSALAAAGCAR